MALTEEDKAEIKQLVRAEIVEIVTDLHAALQQNYANVFINQLSRRDLIDRVVDYIKHKKRGTPLD